VIQTHTSGRTNQVRAGGAAPAGSGKCLAMLRGSIRWQCPHAVSQNKMNANAGAGSSTTGRRQAECNARSQVWWSASEEQ